MNEVLAQLIKTAPGPDARSKIGAAQHAWIEYRDAYTEAMFPAKDKQLEYGSMYPMKVDLLRVDLTREHISDLRALLRQYKPPGY